MSHTDLGNYSVKVQPALESTYRDRKVYTTHPPTSGPGEPSVVFLHQWRSYFVTYEVLIHLLNLLEHFDVKERNVLSIHRLVEFIKFGFASR